MMAEYDAKNPQALGRLLRQGVQLRAFPKDIMTAAYKASVELYDEEAKKNPSFRKIYTDWKKFRDNTNQWLKVSEAGFTNFMYTVR